jgi:CRISPR/Cas system-associated exonuclease Cas4 (RecB family)
MQHLYTGVREINADVLLKLKSRINDVVDQSIHEEFVAINQLEGKNILLRNILRELIGKILESERKDMPLTILQLEKDVSGIFTLSDGRQVKLYGIIDRVDEQEGILRIVDYKTGKIGRKTPGSLADYFTDPAMKEQFQAMYYAFLTQRQLPGKPVKSGLLAMRDMSEGIWFLNKQAPFTADQFSEFGTHLDKLIGEILSPDVPFTQTIDESRCNYCAYKPLCNRS